MGAEITEKHQFLRSTLKKVERRAPFNSRRALFVVVCLAPAAVLVAALTYFPLIRGGLLAFQQYDLHDLSNTEFIGWTNFNLVLTDAAFWQALLTTLIWVVGSIMPQAVFGFILALWLRRHFRLRGLYQALIFFPWAMSGFLIGLLWRWLFNAEYGVINDLLMKAHFIEHPVGWLSDPNLALVSVVVANVWYGVPFFTIMILAALQTVPTELSEAAVMDGASKIRALFSIVIPFIRTTLILTIMMRVIWIYNFPDLIYGMTDGGPAGRTDIVNTYMLKFVFGGNYGVASAVGVISFVILFLFTAFFLAATRQRQDQVRAL